MIESIVWNKGKRSSRSWLTDSRELDVMDDSSCDGKGNILGLLSVKCKSDSHVDAEDDSHLLFCQIFRKQFCVCVCLISMTVLVQ